MIKIQMWRKKIEIMQFYQEPILHFKFKLNPLRSPRIPRHAIVPSLLWILIFISRVWETFCTVRWKKSNNFFVQQMETGSSSVGQFPSRSPGGRCEIWINKWQGISCTLSESLKEKKHLWAPRSAVNSLLFKRLQQQIYASSHYSLPTENNP